MTWVNPLVYDAGSTRFGTYKGFSMRHIPDIKLIVWDFDNTLAFRKGGMWSKALSEIAWDHLHVSVPPASFSPHLQKGFPWHDWEHPHTGVRSAGEWWRRMQPVFANAFSCQGLPASLAAEVRRYYTDPETWELCDDAAVALGHFAGGGTPQVLLSNHVPELEDIVSHLGIRRFFGAVYGSARTGYEKPHPAAFGLVRRDFPTGGDILIVGDSLHADIRGGQRAGFKTCWLNSTGKPCPPDTEPDMVISRLAEIIARCPPVL